MQAAQTRQAIAAAMTTVSEFGLVIDDSVVLHNSNRLVVRLLPCDVVARVAPIAYDDIGVYSLWADYRARAEAETEIVRQLAETASPVAPLDPRFAPRVYEQDGFAIVLWAYVEAVAVDVRAEDYANALAGLHAGMRQIETAATHFTDRVADTQYWVASKDVTPGISDADRKLLADTLDSLRRSIVGRGAAEQLLHGEPHQWNLLNTAKGPLFIDFENSCRGPVEYDLAWVPEKASARHPDADPELLGECRGLMSAIIAAHFCRPDNEHPNLRGREEYLGVVREGPPWPALDEIMRRSHDASRDGLHR